ncbi:hypothetical protein E2986_14091 [Frieseomelitta varia]|uniref:Uncharacterized protein n=1 Tax=Frieseomelitta varia TaxID=561572 RepID=A0A833RMC8_9HYME|nr:hypothetical protein E2986_14091 [Frieseomelitta varia]
MFKRMTSIFETSNIVIKLSIQKNKKYRSQKSLDDTPVVVSLVVLSFSNEDALALVGSDYWLSTVAASSCSWG